MLPMIGLSLLLLCLQKELRLLSQRQEFVQLLVHCEEKCGGRTLPDLLALPAERVSEKWLGFMGICDHCRAFYCKIKALLLFSLQVK